MAKDRRADMGIVVSMIAILLIGPALVANHAGALWIPHNDSWAHSRIAMHYAETGEIRLIGFNRAALVGMVLPLGPWAGNIVVEHAFVMACGAAVIAFSYAFARLHLDRISSTVATLTLGVAPGFILLSTSYMTDIPMMAAIAGSLYFGQRWLRDGSPWQLFSSLACGLWGVTVREQALAAPAAVLAASWIFMRGRRMTTLIATVAVILTFGAFEWWRRSLSADDPPVVGMNVAYTVRALSMGVMSLAYVCVPISLLCCRRPHGRSHLATMFFSGFAALLLAIKFRAGALLGNYLSSEGAYVAMSHGTRSTLPHAVMLACVVLAIISTALISPRLLASFAAPKRNDLGLGQAFLVMYLAGVTVQTLSGQAMFERYLFPLIIPLSILALSEAEPSPRQRLAACTTLTFSVLVTGMITLHTWASTGEVWRVAQGMVQNRVSARDIDAGFAWVGFHSRTDRVEMDVTRRTIGPWVAAFGDSRQCVLASMGEPLLPNQPSEVHSYSKYVIGGSDRVYVQRVNPCR